MTDYICYFDGACAPANPSGCMGIGAIIFDNNGIEVYRLSHFVTAKPTNTNNVAEYQAFGCVISKLIEIMKFGNEAIIMGDSKLVIEQMKGKWKMKEGLYIKYALKAKDILTELKKKCTIELKWIPRLENEVCDNLSKECLIANGVKIKQW